MRMPAGGELIAGPGKLFLVLLLSMAVSMLKAQTGGKDSISIDARDMSHVEVLELISLQSGYYFTYNSELLRDQERISLELINWPLEAVLDSLLAPLGLERKTIRNNIVIYRATATALPDGPDGPDPPTKSSVLKGLVRDAVTLEALPYATIALADSKLGTITNSDGRFRLKLPAGMQEPFLIISFMGYENQVLPPDSLLKRELCIELARNTLSIQEVIIRYAEPHALLLQALEKIPDNYLEEASAMTAFYRESVSNQDHCMSHSEAVLEIAKSPYSKGFQKDQVSIRRKRTINDISSADTLWIKLRSGIQTSLGLDVIRNRPEFLDTEYLDNYKLSYEGVSQYDGQLVYIVGFKPEAHVSDVGFIGQVFIEFSSLSIVAVDFCYDPSRIRETAPFFVAGTRSRIRIIPQHACYHANYRKVGEGWYLSQIRADVELKAKKKRRLLKQVFSLRIEMAITDLEPGINMEIVQQDRVRKNQILSDAPSEFDPEFWGVYNTIEPEASLMESIGRMAEQRLENFE